MNRRIQQLNARIDRLLFIHTDKVMWFCFVGGIAAVVYLLA